MNDQIEPIFPHLPHLSPFSCATYLRKVAASIDKRDSSSSLDPWTNHRLSDPRNDNRIGSMAARDHQHHGEVSCSSVEARCSNDEAYNSYRHWYHNVKRRVSQAICRVVVQDGERDAYGVRRHCEKERRNSPESESVYDSGLRGRKSTGQW